MKRFIKNILKIVVAMVIVVCLAMATFAPFADPRWFIFSGIFGILFYAVILTWPKQMVKYFELWRN